MRIAPLPWIEGRYPRLSDQERKAARQERSRRLSTHSSLGCARSCADQPKTKLAEAIRYVPVRAGAWPLLFLKTAGSNLQ